MDTEYKVIKIIDDKFKIYAEGAEIFDDKTNESYGKLETTKDIVTVTETMPKMCICKKRAYIKKSIFDSAATFGYTKIEDELLNVDMSQISNGLVDDLTIRIGDKAKKIK